MIKGLKNLDCQVPWPSIKKRQSTCFTAGQYDESIICQQNLANLSQPLPKFYCSSVNRRRAEFLAGRMSAADAIRRLCGLWYTPGTSSSGAPLWPEGLVGSISHSGSHVVSVVMRAEKKMTGIGIDLEGVITADQVELLMDTVLLPSEIKRFITNQPEWIKRVNSTLVFSLKECFFKALYPIVRKRFYFEAVTILHCSLGGVACMHVVEDLSSTIKSGFQVTGYACLYRGQVLAVVFLNAKDWDEVSGKCRGGHQADTSLLGK